MIARRNFTLPLVILGSLVAGALYAWFVGEDINWDWRNYHEYGAFALLNGRFDVDVAPGGFQTFFNPVVYVPVYILRHYVGAPFWGMLIGAIHGLNLALIYWLSRSLLGTATTALSVAASVAIAAFGPMTLSEVGTSFADILTALPVIGGVGLILSAGDRAGLRLVIAGLLVGGAVGLKLTNAVFLVGAGTSLVLVQRPLAAIASLAIGCVLGLLMTGGAWAWTLWQEFGNPVFPLYNTIFQSPEAPLAPIVDMRFMPVSLLDAVAYPFYWLVGDHRSSEWPFRDPRFAIIIVLFGLCVSVGLVRKTEVLKRRDKQFLLLFAVTYVMWLLEFSIHRYAIGLELMAAPLIVLLLSRCTEALTQGPSPVTTPVIMTVALAIAAWSRPADWFHRPWSDPYRPQIAEALLTPATFFVIEKPMGYVVPLLHRESRVYQVSDIVMPIAPGGSLDQRIRWGLAHPLAGGVWALHLRGSQPRQELLVTYGLEIDASRACEMIPGADRVDIEACPVLVRPSPVRDRVSSRPPD
jgi:hypothetical protein